METFDYPIGTLVRLVASHEGLASGAEGVVIGYYQTDPPTYAVAVEGRTTRVPPAYLLAIDDEGPPPREAQ